MYWKSKRCMGLTIFAVSAGLAYAGDGEIGRALHGDYGFTTTQVCVRTPFQRPLAAGFDPTTHQLLMDAEVIHSTGSGVLHFSRNGTASMSGVLTEISTNQIAAGKTPVAPKVEFNCDGNYAMYRGDKLTGSFSCNVKQAQPGVSVKVEPLKFEGFIGPQKEVLNLTFMSDDIQTVSVSVGGTLVQQRQRMCTQSASLVKL